MNADIDTNSRAGAFITRRSAKPARTKLAATRDDLRGRMVQLEAVDDNGERVTVEMDAAEAWKDTQQRLETYRKLHACLSGDEE